ncbi:hypothetical protein Cgig2_032772 [Carnegiea gigantea]|uniref:C2 domain-containing protein n=1 Tax=Carnegiea gigantea TaxID=171969 RepID=A0A9Q1GH91_9CARY|nr:hypothetical protein Cgig2_032772 [Carnegiea gigantea]
MGLLEILVIEAHDLPCHDLLHKMDPYVVVRYKGQERKTSVARRQGGNPKWNEKLRLRAEYPGSGSDYKLNLRIMDKDTFSSDDFIGEATIYVEDLLALGVENGSYEMRTTKYKVEGFDGTYCGDIKVGVKFISQGATKEDDEEFGGWKDSYDD